MQGRVDKFHLVTALHSWFLRKLSEIGFVYIFSWTSSSFVSSSFVKFWRKFAIRIFINFPTFNLDFLLKYLKFRTTSSQIWKSRWKSNNFSVIHSIFQRSNLEKFKTTQSKEIFLFFISFNYLYSTGDFKKGFFFSHLHLLMLALKISSKNLCMRV